MDTSRTILHCDLNGFFASVEALSHPEIGNKPMAVCGNPRIRHGVILAKNEAAKKFDISTGEPIVQALRKCPHLVLLEASHDKYEKYSALVNSIYCRFTNRVEPYGIDESWLDVTGAKKLFGDGKTIADTLRRTVKMELGLTISVGVSFNKVFSKLASDYKKPDATTIFGEREYAQIVRELPAKNMLYVGPSTALSLEAVGISTIGQLADANDAFIKRRFGKFGIQLLAYARGEENSEVEFFGRERDVKSVGHSITFKRDLTGIEDIKNGLAKVAEKVAKRLKENQLKGSCVHLTIKGADFKVLTRQRALSTPTNSISILEKSALELALEAWPQERPIRMLGIALSNLEERGTPKQSTLFETESDTTAERTNSAEDAFLKIREKFGSDSIKFGNLLDDDLL